jgi:hypothetical protein
VLGEPARELLGEPLVDGRLPRGDGVAQPREGRGAELGVFVMSLAEP